jgi:hypothetical protein
MQNGYIESFNGKFRDECLNEQWFMSLAQARSVIADWCRTTTRCARTAVVAGFRLPTSLPIIEHNTPKLQYPSTPDFVSNHWYVDWGQVTCF